MIIYQDNNTKIHFNNFDYITNLINSKNVFIIADSNVYNHYSYIFQNVRTFILESKEENKSLNSYQNCISELIQTQSGRDTTIIAIGGGIVCDFAGFVATTYKRGTKLVLVPTTLLAQVDAAIGGKNALNFDSVKNLIGTFRLPDEIIIEPEFLKTLEESEFNNGMSEIIKIAAIYDETLFNYLENNIVSQIDAENLNYVLNKSILSKMDIINLDMYDKGLRIILNFGHTLAHSLESVYKISHGQSVSIGIAFASSISLQNKLINEFTYFRIIHLLTKYGLNNSLNIEPEKLIKFILQDKKNQNGIIRKILICNIGKHKIQEFTLEQYLGYIHDLC
jgi:3-dehydroquinate synthase